MLKLLLKNLEEGVQLVCSRNRDYGLGHAVPCTALEYCLTLHYSIILETVTAQKFPPNFYTLE